MNDERPLDPPVNQERETYYESLFEGSKDDQLERLGLDVTDFVCWMNDDTTELYASYLSEERDGGWPVNWAKIVKDYLDPRFERFINQQIDQAMKVYDIEGLPYEGQ